MNYHTVAAWPCSAADGGSPAAGVSPAPFTTCRHKRQPSGVTTQAGTAVQEWAWAGGNYELGKSGHTRWRGISLTLAHLSSWTLIWRTAAPSIYSPLTSQ